MNKPIKLKPIFKDYLWGGQKLIDQLHKDTDINPCAESWELSTNKDGLSIVDSGEYKGLSLKEVLIKHPEYLGSFSNPDGDAPILIKLIDAKSDLSIQVHPSDEYARIHENSLGKSEVWYILDSDDGHLSVGFNSDTTKADVKKAIDENSICDMINSFSVKKDEFYPIDAGTVHAIGAGCLLVEVQENSNVTYRLYDYNRKDKNGNLRPLHIDKALDVLDYSKYDKPDQSELNYRCPYFHLSKLDRSGKIETDDSHFVVLICIEGSAKIDDLDMKLGDTVFVPSMCNTDIELSGTLLKVEV